MSTAAPTPRTLRSRPEPSPSRDRPRGPFPGRVSHLSGKETEPHRSRGPYPSRRRGKRRPITGRVIQGEADVANVDLLDAALRAVPLDGATSVFVDASGLAFFDVAVLRCLTDFAQVVKRTGRDIATCASPMLHDVARMLELQDELGLH